MKIIGTTRNAQRATSKLKKRQGLVMVFTGDGKGKTTAAVGCAVRMIKHGGKVGMVQFFKRATGHVCRATSEPSWIVDRGPWPLSFKVWSFGGGFTWDVPREENAKAVAEAWKKCREVLRNRRYAMVILDEIHIALHYQFLKTAEVIKALKNRPAGQNVVLTGRGAPKALIRFADLVTEMKCVKHPFQKGVRAQKGIEF